jgi:hypothetical protein
VLRIYYTDWMWQSTELQKKARESLQIDYERGF